MPVARRSSPSKSTQTPPRPAHAASRVSAIHAAHGIKIIPPKRLPSSALKIGHWTMWNKSGMNRVAESIVAAERAIGIDSHLCNIQDETNWDHMRNCDVHVSHTHFPDKLIGRLTKPLKLVWVGHGTPDHVFHGSVEADANRHYGAGDALMLLMHWLHRSDARVTFWPRHQAIYQGMLTKGSTIDCLPMGIDHSFWSGGASQGKFAGEPSVFSAENAHYIKWPYDLITAWPMVYPHLKNGSLHIGYLPADMHRWFAPWINATGAGYAMHWSSLNWEHQELRNILKSVDFYCGFVRYGDFNRISLEANVAGAKTISFTGNPYSDFWVPEGDQREIAKHMIRILRGQTKPRAKSPVPHIEETARGFQSIYERLLARPTFTGINKAITVTTPATREKRSRVSAPRRRG